MGVISTPGHAFDVEVSGNLAYVADGVEGIQFIDISNPEVPVEIGSILDRSAFELELEGDLVYVAGGTLAPGPEGVVHMIDASKLPGKPKIIGSFQTP